MKIDTFVVNKKPKDAKQDLIIQHNHLVEAHYDLTLQEKRVILWLASQVQPDDVDFKEHVVKISEFCKIAGLKSKNMHGEIEKTTKSLIQRGLSIYYPSEGRLLQVAWLNSAEYLYKEGSVRLCFSPKLKPYFLEIRDCYTQIDMKQIMLFKSVYSIRLYELLKQYQKLGIREIKVGNLKKFLGIGDSEYGLYANLKCKVLNRAKKEINQKSDIQVDFLDVKNGRKVESIRFVISVSQKANSLPIVPAVEENFVNQTSLDQLRKEFSDEEIQQGLDVLKKYKGEIRNPVLFLKKAIQKGWQPFVEKKDSSGPLIDTQFEIDALDEGSEAISFRKKLLEKLGEQDYNSWVKPLVFNIDSENIIVSARSKFVKNWVENNFLSHFRDCADGKTVFFKLDTVGKTLASEESSNMNINAPGDSQNVVQANSQKKEKKKIIKPKKNKPTQETTNPEQKKSLWQRIKSFWK